MSKFESHNKTDQLEAFFKKNLHDVSMKPEKSAWENIEIALDFEEKEKRKKRFFWLFFIGIGLFIGLSSVFFFVVYPSDSVITVTSMTDSSVSNTTEYAIPKKNETAINSTQKSSNQEAEPGNISSKTEQVLGTLEDKVVLTENKITHNKEITTNNSQLETGSIPVKEKTQSGENNNSDVKTPINSGISKIQLGAFKHAVKSNHFSEVPFKVESETINGITKYFVVSSNVSQDLEKIKEAGFNDAFVKSIKSSSASNQNNSIVSKRALNSNDPVESKNKTPQKITVVSSGIALNTKKIISTKRAKEIVAEGNPVVKHNSDPASKNINASDSQLNEPLQNAVVAKNDNTEKNSTAGNTHLKTEATHISPLTTTVSTTTVASTQTTTPSNSIPTVEKIVETKADSLKKEVKADSVKLTSKTNLTDSVKKSEYMRCAISVIGGPNVYFNHAKSNAFDLKAEKQPVTYSGEIKVEYNFLKNLSAGIGVGYQYQTIQKDSTRFKFSKYISEDYKVNTSFGDLAIDHTILMNGSNIAFPVDTFAAAYKYKSTIKAINVPLYVNWYFINKSRIKAYTGVGINSSYIVSQQSNITLIKENNRDEFYYKSVMANRFNAILILSLGCDIRVYKRFYFTLSPSYRYSLTNYSSSPGVMFKPSYFSGSGGFKFRF